MLMNVIKVVLRIGDIFCIVLLYSIKVDNDA